MRLAAGWHKQSGSVLLAMALVLIVSSSYLLINRLNANIRQVNRQSSSIDVLNQAKAALIGYAVNYPENYPGEAPGYLPCPDSDNDGSPDGACALGSVSNPTIGRLPYRFISNPTANMVNYRDHAGETLWYAVADNYRNNPKVARLNSDTPGNFTVDGTNGDIVAVIFSPGLALAGQDRAGAGVTDLTNYLEDDNATDGDGSFVTRGTGQFNDTLVTITRQELMQAVEKRVLGEVSQALDNYQTTHSAFPWLAPFANPTASAFRGQAGTRRGHLPFHWANDPDSVQVGTGANIAGRNPFSTMVAVRWDNISGATLNSNNVFAWLGLSTVSNACLNDIDNCDEGGLFPAPASLSPAANINCTWTDRDTADCDSFSVSVTVPYTSGTCPLATITRTYTISFPVITTSPVTTVNVSDPAVGAKRLRSVSMNGAAPDYLPAQVNAIQIQDSYNGQLDVLGFFCLNLVNFPVGTGSSTFNATTEGLIAVNNIEYDIDVDDGELPEWFFANGWHELIYLAYASGENLPGDTTAGQDCVTLGASCISVSADGLANPNSIRALAVSAGLDLGGARPSADETDYFESENSFPVDDVFVKDSISTANNDQVRIIATAP